MITRVGNADLYYETINGESHNPAPVVFLHDSLGCTELWRSFPSKLCLQSGLSGIVYDRQGYGKSSDFETINRDKGYLETEADVLINFLDSVSVKRCILFGHSDGGSIALIAAAKYPERISAIITEGAHVFVEPETISGIHKAIEIYNTTNLRERLAKYHGDKVGNVFRAWTETWISDLYQDWNIEGFLKGITCPVLVIQGEHDEYGTVNQVRSIANKVSGRVRTKIIAGAAHSPHKESEDYTVKLTSEFIDEIQSINHK